MAMRYVNSLDLVMSAHKVFFTRGKLERIVLG
jgi:hypothetical protein